MTASLVRRKESLANVASVIQVGRSSSNWRMVVGFSLRAARFPSTTDWSRIIQILNQLFVAGAGFAIIVMASYVAFYYNTIIALALYYFFSSMRMKVPWISCDNEWNTENCTSFEDRKNTSLQTNHSVASSEEFYRCVVCDL